MKTKFPEKVPKFHVKYFHFNQVAGKSRSRSSTTNCYFLERCVIFTRQTGENLSLPSDRQIPHEFSLTFGVYSPNSLSIPWRLVFIPQIPWIFPDIFQCFSWFPEWKSINVNKISKLKPGNRSSGSIITLPTVEKNTQIYVSLGQVTGEKIILKNTIKGWN